MQKSLIEDNHKKINDLYFTVTDSLFNSLSNTDYIKLIDIASQCPLSGGDAVYRARAILAMLQDTTTLILNNCNDFDNSNYKSLTSGNNNTFNINNIKCNIYPNPAKDEIIIEFSENISNATFHLYNLLGKKVLTEKLINSNKFRLSIEKVGAGIYTYSIENNRLSDSYGKLIIIK